MAPETQLPIISRLDAAAKKNICFELHNSKPIFFGYTIEIVIGSQKFVATPSKWWLVAENFWLHHGNGDW